MKKPIISVIIPVYKNYSIFYKNLENNKKFLDNCEIIIINDYPKENISQKIKTIARNACVINNKKNLGFSKSVNLGIKNAKGELIFLLNSDVVLIDNSFKNVVALFEKNKNLFAISFAQKEKNEKITGANKGFFKDGLINHSSRVFNLKKPSVNFWAEGGSTIFRKDLLLKLGLFDEVYSPFYWEDVDLSYRAWKTGYQILFEPKIKVVHQHETTIGKYYHKSFIEKIAFRNQLIFFWKNIFDKKLILKHLINLPKFVFKPGFFEALIKLPNILIKRRLLKKIFKKTDKEILEIFKNYYD